MRYAAKKPLRESDWVKQTEELYKFVCELSNDMEKALLQNTGGTGAGTGFPVGAVIIRTDIADNGGMDYGKWTLSTGKVKTDNNDTLFVYIRTE